MTKVAILLPNSDLMEDAAYAANLYHLDIVNMSVVNRHSIPEAVEKALREDVDVIMARGSHVDIIKSCSPAIPVVDIKITSLEVGVLISRAKSLVEKDCPVIALTGPENMFAYINTGFLEEYYDIKLRFYTFVDPEQMRLTAKQAIEEGADVLIGGWAVGEICEQEAFPFVKTESGRESLLESCRTASYVGEALALQKRYAKSLQTIIDYTYGGIIELDEELRIQHVNRFSENLLLSDSSQMKGRYIWSFIPDISKRLLSSLIRRKKEHHSLIITIDDTQFWTNITPIVTDNRVTGMIISFYEGRQAEPDDESRRRELLSRGYTAHMTFDRLPARSPQMQQLIAQAKRYAAFQFPILISGEKGLEKQTLAECIHNQGMLKDYPFISYNCNEHDDEKLRRLLFEGQSADAAGSEPSAYRGPCTIYLKEISALSENAQIMVMEATQKRPYSSGFTAMASKFSGLRIIASTSMDLAGLVREGRFRDDLYYALSVTSLYLPSLRERRDDVDMLIDMFMTDFQKSYGRFVKLTNAARARLKSHDWPGNMAELRTVLSRLLVNADGYYIDASDVELQIRACMLPESMAAAMKLRGPDDERMASEAELIKRSLKKYGGNREKTARDLGMSTATLWRRMKRYGIEKNEGK